MALDSKDDIVLKLAVKGVDPSEAKRLADSSGAQIEQELRASLQRQQEAYANAARVMSDMGRFYAKQEIADAQQKTRMLSDAAKLLAAEQSAAAKQAAAEMARQSKLAEQQAKQAAQATAAAAKQQAKEVADAAKAEERARLASAAAAKQADAEIQKMGRLQSQALAENLKRDTQAMKEFAAQHAKAAREGTVNWRGWLEVGENATTVLTGLFGAGRMALSKFKELGEEVVRTTQIFQSAHVEIESAREAVDGTASSMELIGAANRAAEAGLDITGKQFGDIARQAKRFADATGIDSTMALDKMTQAIATGNLGLLKRYGLIVNGDEAQKALAKSLHVAVGELSDEGKRVANQNAALTELARRTTEAGKAMEQPLDVAHALEKTFASMKNLWDGIITSIGSMKIPDWLLHPADKRSQDEIDAIDDTFTDPMTGQVIGTSSGSERIARKKVEAQRVADAARPKQVMDALAALGSGSYLGLPGRGADRASLVDIKPKTDKPYDLLADYQKMAEERTKAEKILAENMYADALDILGIKPGQEPEGLADAFFARQSAPAIAGARYTAQEGAGIGRGVSSFDEEAAQAEKKKTDIAAQNATLGRQTKNVEDTLQTLDGKMEVIGTHQVTDGPGLIEKLMFGPSGAPDVLYDKMTEAQQVTFDATQKMTDVFKNAGHSMADAMGGALAAALGENKNLKKALEEQTHAFLMAMSTRAFSEAGWEGAMALKDAAIGNFPGAAAHGVAAAAFTAVGVAAGIGARATYSAPSGAGASTGSTPTTTRNPASSSSSSGGSGDGNPAPVYITVHVNPGGEEAAGRALLKSLQSLKEQTGMDIAKALSI